jgi:hypothetical protein
MERTGSGRRATVDFSASCVLSSPSRRICDTIKAMISRIVHILPELCTTLVLLIIYVNYLATEGKNIRDTCKRRVMPARLGMVFKISKYQEQLREKVAVWGQRE